jgi:hypothetical protein
MKPKVKGNTGASMEGNETDASRGSNPAASVKCHVSYDMAAIELKDPVGLFKKHTNLFQYVH